MKKTAPQYLFESGSKPTLPAFPVPLVKADSASLEGYGRLVGDPEQCRIEIVSWPAQGWRPVDSDSGDQGGVAEGTFTGRWDGDILMGTNEAVGGHYVLGWSCDPRQARPGTASVKRNQVLLWHFNYHPDGGQLFFPLDPLPFVVPLALPGDDIKPESIVAFWFDGRQGLYIHPNIWHEGIFPIHDQQRFLDRQGKVHARVSCDFGEEFGCYLQVPLNGRSGI